MGVEHEGGSPVTEQPVANLSMLRAFVSLYVKAAASRLRGVGDLRIQIWDLHQSIIIVLDQFGDEALRAPVLDTARNALSEDYRAAWDAICDPRPPAVHILHVGRVLCGKPGPPGRWSDGSSIVFVRDFEKATCSECRDRVTLELLDDARQ